MTAPADSRISDERLDEMLASAEADDRADHWAAYYGGDLVSALTELRERRAQAVTVKFQDRVAAAHVALFEGDPTDVAERRDRFGEESNEVCQALGMTREQAHQLVDYTWSRPVGDPEKEIGGAMTTLASICVVGGWDMAACAEAEVADLEAPEKITKIRAKRATRHGRGVLPGLSVAALPQAAGVTVTHRHKKRGTEYVLIGYGKMQAESWYEGLGHEDHTALVDMREVAIYRSVDDGSLWVRPREEFEDGRFEVLP